MLSCILKISAEIIAGLLGNVGMRRPIVERMRVSNAGKMDIRLLISLGDEQTQTAFKGNNLYLYFTCLNR